MTDFAALLKALAAAQVDFIVVGGFAATAHGGARFTSDLDIVYRRTPENLKQLVQALTPCAPSLRGAPPGLSFVLDERTLKLGLNFTLETKRGWINLLGEMIGGGGYEACCLRPRYSICLESQSAVCLCGD